MIGLAGMASDLVNVFYLLFIKHNLRIYWSSAMTSVSIAIILLSRERKNYYIYSLGVIMLSFFTNLLGTTLVGLAKGFDIKISKGIAIGISISGISSSFLVLFLNKLGIDYGILFGIMFFFVIPIIFLIRRAYILLIA